MGTNGLRVLVLDRSTNKENVRNFEIVDKTFLMNLEWCSESKKLKSMLSDKYSIENNYDYYEYLIDGEDVKYYAVSKEDDR